MTATEERPPPDLAMDAQQGSPAHRLHQEGMESPRSSAMFDALTVVDRESLKGVRASSALAGFGRVFARQGDSAANMALAEGVNALSDFVSHNWVVPRWTKWLTLALSYNKVAAVVAAIGAGALVAALTGAGLLPLLSLPMKEENSQGAFLAGHVAFFAFFCCWPDLKVRLPLRCRKGERMLFVDRCCIHQTDKALMVKGIRGLAGFLRETERMVVVFGPTYLEKLWTVYELASFILIHGDPSRILVLPTSWPLPVASTLFLVLGLQVLLRLFSLLGVSYYPLFAAFALYYGVSLVLFLRRWERHLYAIEDSMRNFSIHNAHCAVEGDRPLVQANVAVFMRELRRVAEHVPLAECLESFDALVRQELIDSVLLSCMQSTFPQLLQLATALPFVLTAFDDFAVEAAKGNGMAGLSLLLQSLPTCWIVLLHCNLLLSPLLSRHLELSGWREAAYQLLALSLFFLSMVLSRGLWQLAAAVETVLLRAGLQLALAGFMLALTVWSSGQRCCRQRRPRVSWRPASAGVTVSI